MTLLADLPPELIAEIALWVHSPMMIDEYDLRCGDGIFTCIAGQRRKNHRSLLALGATCRAVRAAVRPSLFRCVDLNSVERCKAAVSADWRQHVKIVKFSFIEIVEPLSPVWQVPLLVSKALEALPNVEHLEFDVDVSVISLFGILVATLFPPGVPSPPADAIMSKLRSLSLRFCGQWDSPIDLLSFAFPVIWSARNLEFLLIETGLEETEIPTNVLRDYLPKTLTSFSAVGTLFSDTGYLLDALSHCTQLRYLYQTACDPMIIETLEDKGRLPRPPALEIFFFGGDEDRNPFTELEAATLLAQLFPNLQVAGRTAASSYYLVKRTDHGPRVELTPWIQSRTH